MNRILTLLACIAMPVSLLAQKGSDVPAFGKVEKADLEMKECDFDAKAEAVVLFDIGELYCNIQSVTGDMELEHHVRIKILKDKGKDKADIHLPYYAYKNIESIRNLQAQTYNLDGAGNVVTTKVEKSLIYDKTIDKYHHEQVFTFPAVKAGSIIEYKWKQTWNGISLEEWYFQHDIPVKYSRYRVDFPNEIELYSTPYCVLPYESKKENKSNRNIQTYVMKNIPALRDEPYISSDKDYLQRVEFRVMALNLPTRRESMIKNWPEEIKKLMEDEDFGIQLKRNIPRTSGLDSALKNITDPYRKMVTIHEYVRKNMEWNGLSNIWALNGVKSAWKEKKGTSGEINLILVNLLKDADLKAHALLVSTREHGAVASIIADISQFNKVLAYVEIDDKVYVLDATEKTTPSYLIPRNVMYSEGLVIEKPETFEWGWKPIWTDKLLNKNVLVLQATIDEKDAMNGNAALYSYDYAREQRIEEAKKDKAKFLEKYFKTNNQAANVDSLVLENLEADTLPLVQKVHFNIPVSSAGDYKYFSTNLFTSLEKNPFVADNRFSDVFFGTNQSFSIVANIKIPEGYAFEALPKDMRMIMPDTSISITRRMATQDNQLSVRVSLVFTKPFFAVQEYPDFKEFYKQLFAILSEQIAIKKKG
ncbi:MULTISPECIES: DUF3857 domain-containing protein [Niastella]|uniref:DUF3857 domain-containing protein n=1 Tax=Niastella soli TaxID=2821487 RepID=A0ABS3YVP5_9BACT|nr:DUF3857 domain-containing protein [Niastella soli]MBO9201823.1 DUF3857 domain-containing protein [Niastella soli]